MRKLILAAILAAPLTLAACATATENTFAASEAADTAALSALVVYQGTPTADATVIAKLVADQKLVDAAFAPAEAEVAAGEPVTNATAITSAIAVLEADEAAAGISTVTAK